jgi:hypothetical protein
MTQRARWRRKRKEKGKEGEEQDYNGEIGSHKAY